jgi:hypothetical protein
MGTTKTARASSIAGLLLAIGFVWAGCASDPFEEEARQPVECSSNCRVSDPSSRCVFPDGCKESNQCPSGTMCSPGAASAERAGCCALSSAAGRCTVVTGPTAQPRALINGFKVREFSIEAQLADGAPASFSWGLPPDAVTVTCALFVCTPEFARVGSLEDTAVFDITNFDECVVGRQIFDVSGENANLVLSFDLGSASEYPEPDGDCRGSPKRPARCTKGSTPRVTELRAGCWAYGISRVVAATALLGIEPKHLPAMLTGSVPVADCQESPGLPCYLTSDTEQRGPLGKCAQRRCSAVEAPRLPLAVQDCATEGNRVVDGLNCFPTALGGFGTCDDGRCLTRCRAPSDCEALSSEPICCKPLVPRNDPHAARTCHDAAGPSVESFLGVCLSGPRAGWVCPDLPDAGAGS